MNRTLTLEIINLLIKYDTYRIVKYILSKEKETVYCLNIINCLTLPSFRVSR